MITAAGIMMGDSTTKIVAPTKLFLVGLIAGAFQAIKNSVPQLLHAYLFSIGIVLDQHFRYR
jgi:hypothetical protein